MKSGGLALHKIAHLSPSSINLWAASPSTWVMERLLKARAPVGCAAHRGAAAEAGIVAGLQDFSATVEACQAIGLREFDRLTALSSDPRREKERDGVPGIIARGIAELRQYGPPSGYQGKVEHMLPGVPVPVLGYWDVRWDQHGVTLDIKSQLRLASEISTPHARQVSLYIHGTNHEGRVAYITPAKVGVYVLTNPTDHIAAMVNVAQRMDRFLAISADPAELASLLVPDLESFYLNDPLAQANARRIYGFEPVL